MSALIEQDCQNDLLKNDLVYFTTRVPDMSVTRVRHKQHECNTCATRTTRVQHE